MRCQDPVENLWVLGSITSEDASKLVTALLFLNRQQGASAEKLASHCAETNGRNLVLAMARLRQGNADGALRLLAPIVLTPHPDLTATGRQRLRDCLIEAAESLDPDLADILKPGDRATLLPDPVNLVKRFFFGPRNVGRDSRGLTMFDSVQARMVDIKARQITPISTLPHFGPRIEFLKHYSSYTPLTDLSDKALGGGYFLINRAFGCVIDPGYDFAGTFLKRHNIQDIHAIVVTHCHDDHNADLPALLSLLYQDRASGHKVRLFLDPLTFDRYRLLLSYPHILQPCEPLVAPPSRDDGGGEFTELSEGVWMRPLPARHIVCAGAGPDTAVGLHFRVNCDCAEHDLVISGDTAWDRDLMFPVYRRLAVLHPILVAHVSTASIGEALGALHQDPSGYHSNHLGIRGTMEMIQACEPSHVVLSEVGEELVDVIEEVASMIARAFRIPCTVGMMGTTGEVLRFSPEVDLTQLREDW